MRILTTYPLVAAGTVLLLIAPAQAIQPEDAAKALAVALSAGSHTKVTFQGATADGPDVVVKGLAATEGKGTNAIAFETVTIVSPTDGGGGLFSTPAIRFTGGSITGKATGTIGGATINDVVVLDPAALPKDAAPTPAQGLLFKTAEVTDIAVTPQGKDGQLHIGRIAMELGNVVDNVPLDSKGTLDEMTIPAAAFAEGPVGPAMLGYGDLVLDFSWDGSRSRDGKSMDLRDFTVAIRDAGTVSVRGKFDNMPAPTALNDAGARTTAGDVIIDDMTIRYEDASLAGRVLDLQAQKQGVTRDAYAGQIGAALPFLLASLNNPPFQAKVSEALAAFLKDPKSLTVTLAPGTPISAQEVAGLARTSPQELPERLNAEINANTPN